MASIETLANYAEIFGALTVVGGLVFAAIQIKLARDQRRDTAAMSVLSSYTANRTFPDAMHRVMATQDIMKAYQDDEVRQAVDEVNMTMESVSLMVFQRALPLSIVAEWAAGGITRAWEKIEPLHELELEERGGTSPFDWWGWLVNMIERHHSDLLASSAIDRHVDWKPL